MRVLFVTSSDERRASSRCRVYQYLPHLAAQGIEGDVVSWRPPAAELCRRADTVDAVFLQKRVFSVAKLLLLRQRVPRLLFDFDDAIWLRRGTDGAVRQAPLQSRLRLAATLRLDVPRVVARGDALGGLDQIAEAVRKMGAHDDRGERHPDDRRPDRRHDQPDRRRKPCRHRVGHEHQQKADPGGGPERQDPEHTRHAASLRSA